MQGKLSEATEQRTETQTSAIGVKLGKMRSTAKILLLPLIGLVPDYGDSDEPSSTVKVSQKIVDFHEQIDRRRVHGNSVEPEWVTSRANLATISEAATRVAFFPYDFGNLNRATISSSKWKRKRIYLLAEFAFNVLFGRSYFTPCVVVRGRSQIRMSDSMSANFKPQLGQAAHFAPSH
jgi:hypothetical protein